MGLRLLLNQQPPNESVDAQSIAGVVGLIHDRMHGAADAIQRYVPRDWTPPAG